MGRKISLDCCDNHCKSCPGVRDGKIAGAIYDCEHDCHADLGEESNDPGPYFVLVNRFGRGWRFIIGRHEPLTRNEAIGRAVDLQTKTDKQGPSVSVMEYRAAKLSRVGECTYEQGSPAYGDWYLTLPPGSIIEHNPGRGLYEAYLPYFVGE